MVNYRCVICGWDDSQVLWRGGNDGPDSSEDAQHYHDLDRPSCDGDVA